MRITYKTDAEREAILAALTQKTILGVATTLSSFVEKGYLTEEAGQAILDSWDYYRGVK